MDALCAHLGAPDYEALAISAVCTICHQHTMAHSTFVLKPVLTITFKEQSKQFSVVQSSNDASSIFHSNY